MEKWTVFEIDNAKDFKIVNWLLSSKKNRPKQILLV